MRFLVNGPVSSIFCLPTRPQRGSSVRIIFVGHASVHDTTWSETSMKVGEIFFRRVVYIFRLFLCVEVIEIAEELIETVIGGQVLVHVPEVVLAKLTGGIAQWL